MPSHLIGRRMPAFRRGAAIDNYNVGKPMRPDVALAFDRLAAAARGEAGLHPSIASGFRSDAEQARLWAAKPMPHLFPRCRAVWRPFHPVAPT
jgi:D-alanyl-D-alanine carboxypeptidase